MIVDHCHVLIAVWDGLGARGVGGTGQIVEYAQKRGCSVVWIDASSAKITWPRRGDDFVSQLRFLAEYNAESLTGISVADEIEMRCGRLEHQASEAGLDAEVITPLRQCILPHFVKSTTLAGRYQGKYLFWGTVGYALAALAVATAAYLSLMNPTAPHPWYLVEALLLFGAGTLGLILKYCSWQRKWIDFRYLAERLWASCFLYIAGIDFEPPESYPDQRFPWLPDGWITIALREQWRSLPVAECKNVIPDEKNHVRSLARFLHDAWIHDQQTFYESAREKNHWWNEFFEWTSLGLLGLTLGISVAHAFKWLEHMAPWAGNWQSAAAVAFPAVVTALAGITVYRHFHRNAQRYASMSRFLETIGAQIRATATLSGKQTVEPNLETIRALTRKADRAMAHEHEGWRTVFGVRLPGPG